MSTRFSLFTLITILGVLGLTVKMQRHREGDKCSGRWRGSPSKGQEARGAGCGTPACLAQPSPWWCPQSLLFSSCQFLSRDHRCSTIPFAVNSLPIQSSYAKISYICFCCLWTRNLPDGEGQRQAQPCCGLWEVGETQDWQSATF